MVTISKSLPVNPFATDISVLAKTIQPQIKTIPSPSVFYSQPENQSKITSQIQSARNVVYSVAPPKQTVLPNKVEQNIISKVATVPAIKGSVPVPPAQKSVRHIKDKTSINTTSVDVPDFKPDKIPSDWNIATNKITQMAQDTRRGIVEFGTGAIDFSKNLLYGALFIGAIALTK